MTAHAGPKKANGHAPANDTSSGSPARTGLSAAAVIARWRTHGPIERLSTGWPTFDRDSRGGLIFGHCTYLIGAPNAKKTATLACLADQWAREGVGVGALLVDEAPDDFLVRLAVRAGIPLDACEKRESAVLDQVEAALGALPLRLYGAEWTVEQAAQDLARFVSEHKLVKVAFLADSVQTIASDAGSRAETPRAKVSANVDALQNVAMGFRWAVLATSEMPRASYADAPERGDDMATGKETGAIEYKAKAQLVLRNVKDGAGLVRVVAPKIKRGAADDTEFYLKFDRATHSLTEAGSQGIAEPLSGAQRYDTARARIFRACATAKSNLASATAVAVAAGGEKKFTLTVAKTLIEDGELVLINGTFKPRRVSA